MSTKKPLELLDDDELIRLKLAEIEKLEAEIQKREKQFVPTTYGLPDLLRDRRDDESEEEYQTWQQDTLRNFIEDWLQIHKDGKTFPVKVFPEMFEFISDAFYGRSSRLILWKSRGGGGSVAAAVVVFLEMVYKHRSFINMSGSAKQARAIYKHVCGFWDDLPELKRNFLKPGHPLKSEMMMLNGVFLEAVPASEKQARHQHVSGMVLDEAAQPAGSEVGDVMQTALEGALSEEDHLVLIVSTFHEPDGFFAETWDFAEEKEFDRYKFSIFHSMVRCSEGLEEATDADPKALKFCRTKCPLTERIQHADEFGNVVGEEYVGCNGIARTSSGFQSRNQVIRAKRMNVGTSDFEVEFCCVLKGTPVLTAHGPVKIEDLQLGDLVVTDKQRFRRITDISVREYNGDLIGLSVVGHPEPIYVTSNHPIYCLERVPNRSRGWGTEYKTIGEWDWRPAGSIEEGWWIKNPAIPVLETSPATIRATKYIRTGAGGRWGSSWVESEICHEIDDEVAWLLGYFLGDGHSSSRSVCFSWNTEQIRIRQKIERGVRSLGYDLKENAYGSNPETVINLRFHDKGMAEWFREEFYDGNTKQVPEFVFGLRTHLRRAFLQGWVDADGCIDSNSMRLCTKKYLVAIGAQQLFGSLGLSSSVYQQRNHGFNGEESIWTISLSRKKWDRFCDGESKGDIDDVSRVKKVVREHRTVDVCNLTVDVDNTYCLPRVLVHNCIRPKYKRQVYDNDKIDKQLVPNWSWNQLADCAVGIDWGFSIQAAMVLVVRGWCTDDPERTGFGVVEAEFTSKELVGTAIMRLKQWMEGYGLNFAVYADGENPYNNAELEAAGFDVYPVNFNVCKEAGIANVKRWLNRGKLHIIDEHRTLISQMKKLTRLPSGKVKKENDHGPDALFSAMLAFQFMDEFGGEGDSWSPIKDRKTESQGQDVQLI